MIKTLKIYNSCSEISIYNFYKASFSEDLRYLLKDFNEFEDSSAFIEYTSSETLKAVLKDLVKQYAVLTRDKKTLRLKKMEYEIIFLEGRINIIGKILSIYSDSKLVDVLDLLNDVNIKFDRNGNINTEVEKAITQIKHLKNQIKVKVSKLNKLSGADKEEADPVDSIKQLDKTALSLESHLELGYRIDVRKVTVERWINLLAMSKEKSDAQQR